MPHRTLTTRIRAEFLEMPGLRLTLAQVHRLCGSDRASCEAVLDTLVDERFLSLRHGHYSRLGETDSVDREVKHHGHHHVHGATR